MSRPWLFPVLAGALTAAFFLQSLLSSLVKSPSSDEPPHIAAGLAYVQKGNFVPNPQHPPLLKEMAAVSLLLAGIRLPDVPAVTAMLNEPPGTQLEWGVGNDLIRQGGPPRVMFWARLPLILLATLAALLLCLWARQMMGDTAALGALFLFALDPNLIAHSQFVTTDMGVTSFIIVFFFSLWSFLRRPGKLLLGWCGVAMGMMLCAKFSAVFMMPVALLLMLAAAILPRKDTGKRVAWAFLHFGVMSIVAWLVVMAIYFSPSGLPDYLHGIRSVYADSSLDYRFYMAGEFQSHFTSYFTVAWLLKEPLATIALVVLGSVALIRERRLGILDMLFLYVPPFVLFAACTLRAENIGIRYLIPAFPFLCLAGGAGVGILIQRRSKWGAGVAAALCIWMVVAAAGIYPDHLSYFNEAACLLRDPRKLGVDGGTRCGPGWLDDSNVDWGQGLEQLKVWRSRHADPRTMWLAWFGSFPPEAMGVPSQALSVYYIETTPVPAPGLYVVSAQYVARYPMSWLRTIGPTAIVGHALYVYDIPFEAVTP
jgi:Dolichyl-phosphate-mannose-protein mannosyltransferase